MNNDNINKHKLGTLCPMKILVAEDSLTHQEQMKYFLNQFGYEAVFVEDGHEAVKACQDTHFDLVLMDIEMPNLNGFEAMSQIKTGHSQSDNVDGICYFVAVTTVATFREQSKAYKRKFEDYLPKPYDDKGLSHILLKAFKFVRQRKSDLTARHTAS